MESIVAPRDVKRASFKTHNDSELASVRKAQGCSLGRAEDSSMRPHAFIIEMEVAVNELPELDGPCGPPDRVSANAETVGSRPDRKPDFFAHGARKQGMLRTDMEGSGNAGGGGRRGGPQGSLGLPLRAWDPATLEKLDAPLDGTPFIFVERAARRVEVVVGDCDRGGMCNLALGERCGSASSGRA